MKNALVNHPTLGRFWLDDVVEKGERVVGYTQDVWVQHIAPRNNDGTISVHQSLIERYSND